MSLGMKDLAVVKNNDAASKNCASKRCHHNFMALTFANSGFTLASWCHCDFNSDVRKTIRCKLHHVQVGRDEAHRQQRPHDYVTEYTKCLLRLCSCANTSFSLFNFAANCTAKEASRMTAVSCQQKVTPGSSSTAMRDVYLNR